jgi:hypothetical protein
MKEAAPRAAWGFRIGVVIVLVVAGFLVPRGWVEGAREHVAQGRPEPIDVFDARSAALDAALDADAPLDEAQRAAARARRPQLIARRLLGAGPMSGPEVALLLEQIQGWDAELEGQPEASRRTLRRYHAKRLVEQVPRVDEAAATEALLRFDARWAAHALDAAATPHGG